MRWLLLVEEAAVAPTSSWKATERYRGQRQCRGHRSLAAIAAPPIDDGIASEAR
jgi:hypothetical protein